MKFGPIGTKAGNWLILFITFKNRKPRNISKGNRGKVIAKKGIDSFLNELFFIKKLVKINI